MREIEYIAVHCSATKEGKEFDVADITRWHINKGWSDCGYHYIIKLDGTIELGRPIEKIGAHVFGFNRNSIGICYIGGLDEEGNPKDTRTPEQKVALFGLIKKLTLIHHDSVVQGHRDFSPDKDGDGIIEPFEWLKHCPCFDAKEEYANLSRLSPEKLPFKNKKQGDKFRKWVNKEHPKDAKRLDLDKSGSFNNSYIKRAWLEFYKIYDGKK